MLIRAKTDRDTAAVVDLLVTTHHADGYPRYLPGKPDRFVTAKAELAAWVAELDGEVVGHVALHRAEGDPTCPLAQEATGRPADELAVVARLMVHPAARRRGLARQLVASATASAHEQGRQVVLDVLQESEPVVALYESLGWRRLGPVSISIPDHPDLQLWVYLEPA